MLLREVRVLNQHDFPKQVQRALLAADEALIAATNEVSYLEASFGSSPAESYAVVLHAVAQELSAAWKLALQLSEQNII